MATKYVTYKTARGPLRVKVGSGAILLEHKPREGPIDPGTRRALAALKRLSELGPYSFKKLKP